MICCGVEPVRNEVLGKSFLYCRECKQEVKEESDSAAYKKAISRAVAAIRFNEKIDSDCGGEIPTPKQTSFPFMVGDILEPLDSSCRWQRRLLTKPNSVGVCKIGFTSGPFTGSIYDAAYSDLPIIFKLIKRGDSE